MDDFGMTAGIGIAIAATIAVVAQLFLQKREQKIIKEREQNAFELETKIRMSTGLDVITDFNELARVYILLDRLNDAESAMRKAIAIAETEYGQMDPTLAPILENYASVLDKMNRKVEAEKVRKRAKDIAQRRK